MNRFISHREKPRAGFALVVVLFILVLLVGLAVGMLGRVTAERAAVSEYQSAVSTRQLADSAVGLVQGQINIATMRGADTAWTSQPGMVKTFGSDGELLAAYKLYSAADMISANPGVTGGKSTDAPPKEWGSDVAVWTDLNAPVEVGGVKNFPILDPGAAVDGYAVDDAPGATAYQPVPMPVRWLYVLRDGSMVAPAGSGNTATVAETKANPIVGRVAFWADDDTCKVNINTASEGTYWDTPRAASEQELDLAKYQPAQREFQRYPGHPAMTSLSAVFPDLTASQIYGIAPRVVGGGSDGGSAIAASALTPDADRLYDNVDELIFNPARASNAGLDKSRLEAARFFLTARSRAPETNLFNLPRIACWPIERTSVADWSARTTAFDRLIAFCSKVNDKPYFFQRENAASLTNDIGIPRNTELYSYLRFLTGKAIPGFGGNFSAKYGDDRDQILTEIFDYIRCANLADATLAAGKRFANSGVVLPTQYQPGSRMTMGFGRSWALSELAIGFICNAQADDPATTGVDESSGSNEPPVNPPPETDSPTVNWVFARGEAPLSSPEKYIQAIIVPEFFSVMQGWVEMNPTVRMKVRGLGGLKVEGKDLFGSLDDQVATIKFSGGLYLTINGGSPSWRTFGMNQCSPQRGNLPGDAPGSNQFLYPFIGIPVRISPSGSTMKFSGGSLVVELYPAAGDLDEANLLQRITLKMPQGDFPIPRLATNEAPYGAAPDSTVVNGKETWWAFSRTGAIKGKPGRLAFIDQRSWAGGLGAGDFFRADKVDKAAIDTVRSMLPSHGDFRLVAGRRESPDTLFVKHPAYDSPTERMAHNLSAGTGTGGGQAAGRCFGFDVNGKYLASLSYPDNLAPDIPSNATQTPEATGDYDTGISLSPDGPYINKPDEGNIKGLSDGTIPYFDAYYQWSTAGTTFFSPNRQMPSPGMFGSLSTGVLSGTPWQTLLFRPQAGHPGSNAPADHLFLDLFWMPVVEPYAISDRFSTAGKINMNYQILPFSYITRSTGLNALFKSEKIAAIPNSALSTYKPATAFETVAAANPAFRLPVDAAQTLSQFKAKFDSGKVFKSASEICDLHLVPEGQTVADMAGPFWTSHALTGENLRERIYTTLYPRLTTKSNTFTVHFRVQALRKVPRSSPGTWTENQDIVLGEYRGSTTIERFIDAGNPDIPDYAANPASIGSAAFPTLDKFYKWRVLENRQFAP